MSADGRFSLAKLFGITLRESANDGSDFTNPDADYRRLFLGEDGQLHLRDSAGAVTDVGSGTPAAADVTFDPTGLDNTAAADVQAALEDFDAAISAAAGGSGGGLLAVATYATGSDTSFTSTATSDADLNTANAAVAFVAPASGNVLVRLSALTNPGGGNVHWTVREGSTTKGDAYQSSTLTDVRRSSVDIYITGLAAGAHTFKWGVYTSGGTITIYHGPVFGKLVLEVWAAP